MVQFLTEQGCDLNSTAKDGMTALLTAIFYNKPQIVEYLLDNGTDIDYISAHNKTHNSVSFSALRNNSVILCILLQRGASIVHMFESFYDFVHSNMDPECKRILRPYLGWETKK